MGWKQMIFVFLRSLLRSQAELAAENLVLRQQLAILEQRSKRPRLRNRDRIFWTWVARLWSNGRSVLVIVQPDTVIGWHRQGFRLYWRWTSRGRSGRPKIDAEIRKLIRRMSRENPLWGTPRIRSELRLLGYEASKATVDKYRIRHHKPPSTRWRFASPAERPGGLRRLDHAIATRLPVGTVRIRRAATERGVDEWRRKSGMLCAQRW